jgi:hypothetical protein
MYDVNLHSHGIELFLVVIIYILLVLKLIASNYQNKQTNITSRPRLHTHQSSLIVSSAFYFGLLGMRSCRSGICFLVPLHVLYRR